MRIEINKIYLNDNAIDYVADDSLIKAVEIALALNKPIIVTGEPGTGKTKLADYVAKQLSIQTKGQEFEFLDRPLVFNTKSTSLATDLFYFYDAVSHFRSQHANLTTDHFIELGPMGLAIAHTYENGSDVMEKLQNIGGIRDKVSFEKPMSSVLLIDEIDKAPRDFPNDLLNELEQYSFKIKELNKTLIRAKNDCRILVIITSNSEKNLPNAFLRRCVFYHIEFPDKFKLLQIAKKRLTINDSTYDELIEKAIDEFNIIRGLAINKKPSTSEFLDWINILRSFNLLNSRAFHPEERAGEGDLIYNTAKGTLIKNFEDQQLITGKENK